MSDNGFLRRTELRSVLSRIKDRVGSDIASAISESTSSLSSVITLGDSSSVSEAKGYADGLKIIIDSNLSNHTGNTNNPHSVTYNQVGAAAASHTHTESDIIDLGSYASSTHTHTESDITDLGSYASSSHTHVESDITDLGSYALSNHTHTESDITDFGSYANSSHTHTESDITDLGNYANASHSHNLSDINNITASSTEINYLSGATGNIQQQLNSLVTSGTTVTLADLGGASATDLSNHTGNTNNPHSVTYTQVGAAPSSHTHTESDITDLGSYAASSHSHILSDILDASSSLAAKSHTHDFFTDITGIPAFALQANLTAHTIDNSNPHFTTYTQVGAAPASHTHELTDVTDITATATEVNYLTNSTSNIQNQINDLKFYGFFPAWEYQQEYNIEDCIKIPCCTTTQYLECIVEGISGYCPEYPISAVGSTTVYKRLDQFESVSNGQCIVDGTCVWLVQDIRDARVIGSITPLLWRPMYTYGAFDNYGIGLVNTVRLYDGRSSKQSDMSKADNLKFIRLLKRIIGSAIFTLNMSRIFKLSSNSDINNSSSTELTHIGGALVILDWCFRPFDYLSSSHYGDIDSRASQYIENILSGYNSTFSVNLTKTQIVNDAIAKKTKIYNNQLTNDYLYFETNSIGKYGIMQSGNYGLFIDAGLPELSGSLGYSMGHGTTSNRSTTSLLYWNSNARSNSNFSYTSASGNNQFGNASFKASNGNAIYGNSITVQPNTIQVYYYMKY